MKLINMNLKNIMIKKIPTSKINPIIMGHSSFYPLQTSQLKRYFHYITPGKKYNRCFISLKPIQVYSPQESIVLKGIEGM
jgi:hypothetical protein